ncbi:MAG: hypothetical protein U5K54_18205 [Cytophagales bacterium]|nr:hypothetical protein [Cytophagales bacterium]
MQRSQGNNLIAGNTYSWIATANGSVSGESTLAQSGKSYEPMYYAISPNGNQVVSLYSNTDQWCRLYWGNVHG